MRRMELFEIHDQPRFPALLRDLVTDALQSLWDFSNSYRPVLLLLRDALAKAGTRDVLDLCSGAGGPWFGLVREFDSEHHFPIHVRLTDKYPNRKAFEKVPASQMSMVETRLVEFRHGGDSARRLTGSTAPIYGSAGCPLTVARSKISVASYRIVLVG